VYGVNGLRKKRGHYSAHFKLNVLVQAKHKRLSAACEMLERRDQGSITLASLMANYDISRQLSVQLNVSNLFDKTYFDFAGSQIYYGMPRKLMLTAK
jgi:outer membrane receptor for ferric coprogen and ferric-rhodotorulic acid